MSARSQGHNRNRRQPANPPPPGDKPSSETTGPACRVAQLLSALNKAGSNTAPVTGLDTAREEPCSSTGQRAWRHHFPNPAFKEATSRKQSHCGCRNNGRSLRGFGMPPKAFEFNICGRWPLPVVENARCKTRKAGAARSRVPTRASASSPGAEVVHGGRGDAAARRSTQAQRASS